MARIIEERRSFYDDQEGDPKNGNNLQMQKLLLIRSFIIRIKMWAREELLPGSLSFPPCPLKAQILPAAG